MVISVEPASYHLALPKEGVLKRTLRIQERQGRARHTTLTTTVFTPREPLQRTRPSSAFANARFQGQRLGVDAGRFLHAGVIAIEDGKAANKHRCALSLDSGAVQRRLLSFHLTLYPSGWRV